MDVRQLVKAIDESSGKKGFKKGHSCIGIGPFNWVFRHVFPSCSGLYWFYFDQTITTPTGRTLKAKDVIYIGMTNGAIKGRFAKHMSVSRRGDGWHPWGAGEGWEFSGTFLNKLEKHEHEAKEFADLVRTGQIWVGWFCLTAPANELNQLESLESEMIAKVKQEDGSKPFFNVND